MHIVVNKNLYLLEVLEKSEFKVERQLTIFKGNSIQ